MREEVRQADELYAQYKDKRRQMKMAEEEKKKRLAEKRVLRIV